MGARSRKKGPAAAERDAPEPGVTASHGNQAASSPMSEGEKVYVGVRVRMPVKDLLQSIRRSQGDGAGRAEVSGKGKGVSKRVRARPRNRTIRVQHSMKSLEELAIILEVLEDDLRTGNTYQNATRNLPASPVHSELCTTGSSDEYDEVASSPESYTAYCPSTAEYHQATTPTDCMLSDLQHLLVKNVDNEKEIDWYDHHNLNSSAFFWRQLQRAEDQLKGVSDEGLLVPDRHGRIALHTAVCFGKRALGYAIAKRMAAFGCLDVKDSDGMTALLYAAKHNQHLIVADLIRLGANVNETNRWGKSCLHLSAESGYIRVLEVLKHAMLDGVLLDVEATDHAGMTVLQCVSVTLKRSMRGVEGSRTPSQARLQALRQEQMMETLECLLQMTTISPAMTREPALAAQHWLSSQLVCPEGQFITPTVMF
ncbi:nuclear factor NF-kappa-B p105 subunit [Oryzias melastigma]|uniref:Zgc:113279 n=1 Tax=Oryzias melastigma TaxID=30732 RepID=A0A3B3BPA0_ORYME|nr:nuclear factor NF-kappa-B p105 subunit [Oryzias melastigma]